MTLERRKLLLGFSAAAFGLMASSGRNLADTAGNRTMAGKLTLTAAEWRQRLSPEAYRILRENGTERAFSSPLNDEKRVGTYHCAGCDLALFASEMKYDSGTGWPSFFDRIEGSIETRTDWALFYPRTEYHCARCGGHQGHVFDDGPPPTGLRYCNNGLALNFRPAPRSTG